MLNALKKMLPAKPSMAARATYIALVAQARNPFFFGPLGVPDTLDGRFELIVLHLFLLQDRLRDGTAPSEAFGRELSEIFFEDMDRSLREFGIGDTGVKHRIKKMGKAYHGRLQAYAAGFADTPALPRALARNLYGTVENGDIGMLVKAVHYLQAMRAALRHAPTEAIRTGHYSWPAPEAIAIQPTAD